MTTKTERKWLAIEDTADLWCWVNTWGDLLTHGYPPGSPHSEGYRRAIKDALSALEAAGITFDKVPDETWERWANGDMDVDKTLSCACGWPDKDCREGAETVLDCEEFRETAHSRPEGSGDADA